MIPDNLLTVIAPSKNTSNNTGVTWQLELAKAIKDPLELLCHLELNHQPRLIENALKAARLFPLKVTHSYLSRIAKGQIDDPLLRQILPLEDELKDEPGFITDPVGDLQAMQTPGLLHKYHGRALLITTGACAIHCRYCFRRSFPYASANTGKDHSLAALGYIKAHTDIQEIILSGGDPLTLSNRKLAELILELSLIPHIQRIRIHSRLPIVLPSRIDRDLIDAISHSRLQTVMVIHCNHPNEIDTNVQTALNMLYTRQIPIFNQAVLLRGVNDSVQTLSLLSEKLFAHRVIPYYLHQLDKASGTAHFEVSAQKAVNLMNTLRRNLPGYLLPRLVREIAGEPAKVPLF